MISGKWHLGLAEGCRPNDHGFDEFYGFLAGCIDYFSHIFYWGQKGGQPITHDLWRNDKEVWENGEYATERITDEAVDFIRRSADSDEPFFLFVSYNAPHYPMHAPKKYVDRFPHLSPDRRIMAAMLSAVDDGVGEIMNELERQGMAENTFAFFQSDNGPSREVRNWLDGTEDPYYGGSSGGLKGHKFSLYEGGIRMPAIMHWPARIPGGQVISEPGAAMDIFPTILRAAGGDASQYELDGADVLPMTADGAASPHDEIFWEMGDQTAVRRGKHKLVLNGRLEEGAPPEDDVHLADLETDMSESRNLRDEQPEIAEELRKAAEAWRAGIAERWEKEFQPFMRGTT